jgi:two-component system, NarL family, nitrate/nitrite response regulator NarL
MIFVLILGPVRVYRESLAAALERDGRVHVIGAAASPEQAKRRLRELGPDVVLVDTTTLEGIGAAKELAMTESAVKLIALAAPEEDSDVIACAEAGVSGFVAREGTLDDIVTAAEAVLQGETACPPRVAAALLRRVAASARERELERPQPHRTPLTLRERQIITLIDEGLSNKEIAGRLCIEVGTVKNHVHNILEKLGARRRTEAVARLRMVVRTAPGESPVAT